MRVVGPAGTSFTGRFLANHGFHGYSDYGLALPRETLDTLIAEEAGARGAELREGVHADIASVGPESVEIEVRGKTSVETVQARLLIAADGLTSRVARRSGLARRGALRRIALVTHAVDVAGMSDVGEMHLAGFGYVGLAAIGHGVTNVAIVIDLDRVGASSAPAERWFYELLPQFAEVADRMRSARLVTPVRGVGPFARWTSRATADRTLLVGDAADFHDPFTGEGIYAALHGGELAATHAMTALERGRFAGADLVAYDRARRRAFRGKWLFEKLVSGAIARPAVFDRCANRIARQQDLADLMIGVAGDFVPVSRLFRPRNLWQLVI
jgi:flavin-dependent dehydrogenase